MHFETIATGSGVPLVFLHGILGTWEDWIPVCKFLPDRHCIGVDLPGHGQSPFTENFNEELVEVADRFHLIGYSMGGRLAMGFAEKYPEKVASLTVISAHFGLPETERSARLKIDEEWAKMLQEKPLEEFLNKWYQQPLFRSLNREQMVAKRGNQKPDDLARVFVHYSLGRQPIFEPKGTVIIGEWDTKYSDLYKKHRPIILAEAGHAVHLEQPQKVAEIITSHCK
ncbi:MAG: alpha/beta fold hydrolase [Verrucomicrobia bacterium]|nr:alpha/beta fold hydrolase [Verrucomicrobiota bacterium]